MRVNLWTCQSAELSSRWHLLSTRLNPPPAENRADHQTSSDGRGNGGGGFHARDDCHQSGFSQGVNHRCSQHGYRSGTNRHFGKPEPRHGYGDRIHVGDAGDYGEQIDASFSQPSPRRMGSQDNQREQQTELQCLSKLDRVAQFERIERGMLTFPGYSGLRQQKAIEPWLTWVGLVISPNRD
jgi:hypothetical protein